MKTNKLVEEYKINLDELSEVKYISFNELEQLIKDKPSDYPFAARDFMPKLLEELRIYKDR